MSGGQQVNVYETLKFFPGARVEGAWNGSFDKQGRTYYVNNITGNQYADGLSWNSAVAQFSDAVTLSETFRKIGAGALSSVETNDFVKNRIVLQGTGTMYEPVSALPSFCDVIGLGAIPFGDGTGIVVLGDADGGSDGMAGEIRGTYFYNMQFIAADVYYAIDLAKAYRSGMDTCAFGSNYESLACARGISVTLGSGFHMKGCKSLMHHSVPAIAYAFALEGLRFNECLIEECYGYGSDTGMQIGKADTVCNGTVVRSCIMFGVSYGIRDTSTRTTSNHLAFYHNNFGTSAGNGMSMLYREFYQMMGNYEVSSTTSSVHELT